MLIILNFAFLTVPKRVREGYGVGPVESSENIN